MTKQSINAPCTICGQKRKLKEQGGVKICSSCLKIAQLIKKDPGMAGRLSHFVEDGKDGKNLHLDHELPDVLDGVRYRTTDSEKNTWYVSVSELDGNPVEIFASTAFENDQHLQSRISNLTTITRLISLILRHIFMGEKLTLEKTLTQLARSSRRRNDLPEMLGKILLNYKEKSVVKNS
jgi:hypothetical protein